MKNYLYIFLIVLIASCKKDANVKLPEIKRLPVVNCFISPGDTLIKVKLTWSKPLFAVQASYSFDIIPDANVKIFSASGSAAFTYNNITQLYELKTQSFPILNGERYELSVDLSDGSSVTAETTVPVGSVKPAGVSFETISDNYGLIDRYKVWFYDNNYIVKYFRIVERPFTCSIPGDTIYSDFYMYDKLFTNSNASNYMEGIVDRGHNTNPPPAQDSIQGTDYFILNGDKNYYQFHLSVLNAFGNGNGNPFTEPTLIYSNVKGGLGIFASYVLSTPYRRWD